MKYVIFASMGIIALATGCSKKDSDKEVASNKLSANEVVPDAPKFLIQITDSSGKVLGAIKSDTKLTQAESVAKFEAGEGNDIVAMKSDIDGLDSSTQSFYVDASDCFADETDPVPTYSQTITKNGVAIFQLTTVSRSLPTFSFNGAIPANVGYGACVYSSCGTQYPLAGAYPVGYPVAYPQASPYTMGYPAQYPQVQYPAAQYPATQYPVQQQQTAQYNPYTQYQQPMYSNSNGTQYGVNYYQRQYASTYPSTSYRSTDLGYGSAATGSSYGATTVNCAALAALASAGVQLPAGCQAQQTTQYVW